MASGAKAAFERLVSKLSTIIKLTEHELAALSSLPLLIRDLRPDQDIVRDGDRPSQCCLIVEGLAYRYKIVGQGKRQIFSYHISGDTPDLQSLHLERMDHNVGTLIATRVAFIPHQDVKKLIETHPRLLAAFWRDGLIDAAVFREWMVGMGRRTALARIAHLLCELFTRYRAVGLSNGYIFPYHLRQTDIGDSLGLSTVHVNRVIQKLKSDTLLEVNGKTITILDWERLQEVAEFDPDYLHLRDTPT
jgi:CRP-like cAMP-binding protein